MPTVSIIIPIKNGARLISETISSLRTQTFSDWEAVIVDDSSTDDTQSVLASLCSNDHRVKYRANSSGIGGAPACRAQGLAGSDSKYVLFMDADDLLAPHCLSERVAILDRSPALDFVVRNTELFRSHPGDMGLIFNVLDGGDAMSRFLLFDFPWTVMGPLWRRPAASSLTWEPSLSSGQDVDFHLQALLQDLNYKTFEEVDCFYRKYNSPGSVGSSPWDEHKLPSHKFRLRRVAESIAEEATLTSIRWRSLWASAHWISRKWLAHHNEQEAYTLWNEMSASAPPLIRDLGCRLLRRSGMRVRDLLDQELRSVWPEVLFVSRSLTLGSVPAHGAGRSRADGIGNDLLRAARSAAAHGYFQDALSASVSNLRQGPTSIRSWKYVAWACALRLRGGSSMGATDCPK